MRLALDPRARRILRSLPHTNVYSATEILLISLLGVQCARFVWALATPLGPLGDWRPAETLRPVAQVSQAVLAEFDSFFRLSGDNGPVTVTSLDIKLFGVREDRASGRGSAIVAAPDGQQRSFAVGDEIMPGVTLSAVGFDSVTISRNGAQEQLFLDQSTPVQTVGPAGTTNVPAAATAPPPLLSEIRFEPRLSGSVVTGVTVQPQGSGQAFRASGLLPGDVILSVNGTRIGSADQARAIEVQLRGAAEADLQIERGGRTMLLRARIGQ